MTGGTGDATVKSRGSPSTRPFGRDSSREPDPYRRGDIVCRVLVNHDLWVAKTPSEYCERARGARRTIIPSVDHNTARYSNNRAEVSHQPTRP